MSATAMTSTVTSFPALGKFIRAEGEAFVFVPSGTSYELTLQGSYAGPLNVPVAIHIRAQGRKLLTVPAGGTFITPIFGPPRVVQGRVRYADDRQVVLQAGAPVVVTLPSSDDALDLNNGLITVGQMVNITLSPGATFEVVAK